ncbi:hypothetical protein, partial [Lichenibacterium dinghuense]|uniref:hypothetical protein n=1 Tax=Lichenibacterium dinghuense TaxID=2895977 RepID=UPI001F338C48
AGRPWRADAIHHLPRACIARAVREPLLTCAALQAWSASGSCAHQAEVGRRILRDRFGVEASVVVGDLMRPMGGGRHHTYTRSDGSISVEAGAYHAWLRLDDGSHVDLAAWELLARFERQGIAWTGPRPDYLWDSPERLTALGYVATIDERATAAMAERLDRGDDGEFLSAYIGEALAVLKRCVVCGSADIEPHLHRGQAAGRADCGSM